MCTHISELDTWDKTVTLLCNLVIHHWSCWWDRRLPICPSEIDAKDRHQGHVYKLIVQKCIFSCQIYTWSRFLALEIKTKQEENPSLPKAAQLKSLSVACHIRNHPYWLCVVFKCVTVNNCALCGTASDGADWSLSWIGTPVLAPEQIAAAYGTFHLSELFAVLGNKCCVHVSKMPDGRSH